ncbi:hypothetical protein SEA_BEUFFERT_145 [Streptomyces phage Beuffert]|nr:hypothetical protein SEA_BEUFFERT_145 [Streptomyces phage Beuffert]
MKQYSSPDNFMDIVVTQHEDDFTKWRVVGVTVDWDAVRQLDIETDFPNKVLAEAFVRGYTDKYVRRNFFD